MNLDDFLPENCVQPEWFDIFDEENQEWIHVDENSSNEDWERAMILLGLTE